LPGHETPSVPPDAFAVFDQQDSGCISYGVERDGRKLFVKTAVTAGGRQSLLRAIRFHRAVRHPAIVHPLDVADARDVTPTSSYVTYPSQTYPSLTYPWCAGEVLNHATRSGSDRSALARFQRLDVDLVRAAIDTILAAHRAVTAAGFVSVDLYDGCFLYDFDGEEMRLIDLDEYRPGPFSVDADRLPGSRRYMAPEEFQRGSTIDERTTVFHLGRTISELLDGERGSRCSAAQQRVVQAATMDAPRARFTTVDALVDAWHAAAI
jgi:serine/threonine-protein kinase